LALIYQDDLAISQMSVAENLGVTILAVSRTDKQRRQILAMACAQTALKGFGKRYLPACAAADAPGWRQPDLCNPQKGLCARLTV
jgi:ABC-type uncharacterized transport system YnjBCD ATPase subunit